MTATAKRAALLAVESQSLSTALTRLPSTIIFTLPLEALSRYWAAPPTLLLALSHSPEIKATTLQQLSSFLKEPAAFETSAPPTEQTGTATSEVTQCRA